MTHATGELRLTAGNATQTRRRRRQIAARVFVSVGVLTVMCVPAMAQGSDPWTTGVTALQTLFTGTVAKGLSLVAIVVGGLMFAFGEGGSMKTMSGIVFGVGMAVLAANFLTWLFGV